jgi:hypothetical protein
LGGDGEVGELTGDVDRLLVARDVAGDVGAFHDETEFFGQRAGVGGAGGDGQVVDDVFDGAFAVGGGDVGRFVGEWEFHRHVDEDAAAEQSLADSNSGKC